MAGKSLLDNRSWRFPLKNVFAATGQPCASSKVYHPQIDRESKAFKGVRAGFVNLDTFACNGSVNELTSAFPRAIAGLNHAMDAILILGAAVWANGPSPTLRRRTEHAMQLWHSGAAPMIIPCGGLGQHPPTEAAAMRRMLLDGDVPTDAIQLEDKSTTTLENIKNAKRLLPGPKIIIVTDSYHGSRALMVARHLQLDAQISSPEIPKLPIRQHIREILARPAYAIKLRRLPRD